MVYQLYHDNDNMHVSIPLILSIFTLPRIHDKIHHIRIIKDGKQFITGGFPFDSLVELIYYYKYQSIYRDTMLTHPINKDILEQKVRE